MADADAERLRSQGGAKDEGEPHGLVVAVWLTLPTPTAAAAPVPDTPLAVVSAAAGARATVPLAAAEEPEAFAVGFPRPADVLVEKFRVVVVAAPPVMCVLTPMPAAVGAGPTVGREPAKAGVRNIVAAAA